jgi:hypothetical protein
MERNWDCVRKILMGLEALGDTQSALDASGVHEYDPETVSYHLRLLIESGLVRGTCLQGLNGPLRCHATGLTWEGHEFLDKIRSQGLWNKIKSIAREKGLSLSFDVIKAVAVVAIKELLGS